MAAGVSPNTLPALSPLLLAAGSIKVWLAHQFGSTVCHGPSAMALMSAASAAACARSSALPASDLLGGWEASMRGSGSSQLSATVQILQLARPVRSQPRMGAGASQEGIFAPLVVVTRNIIGKKRFNQLRGKAIAVHSQVIHTHAGWLDRSRTCLPAGICLGG